MDDKLWDAPHVKAYLRQRKRLTDSEKRERKRKYNATFYRGKKTKREEIRDQLRRGLITEEEANRQYAELKTNVGWYRTYADQAVVTTEYRCFLQRLILVFGSQTEKLTCRIPAIWPTEPSVESYIAFLLRLIPIDHQLKISDPFSPAIARMLKALLHPQLDCFSSWLAAEDKARLLPILNGSISVVNEKNWNASEKARQLKRWADVRNQYILSFAPRSLTLAPFVWEEMLQDAFETYKAMCDGDTDAEPPAEGGVENIDALGVE